MAHMTVNEMNSFQTSGAWGEMTTLLPAPWPPIEKTLLFLWMRNMKERGNMERNELGHILLTNYRCMNCWAMRNISTSLSSDGAKNGSKTDKPTGTPVRICVWSPARLCTYQEYQAPWGQNLGTSSWLFHVSWNQVFPDSLCLCF